MFLNYVVPVQTLQDKLPPFIKAATILGMCVVGALIASFVSINVVATLGSGESSIVFQEMLDSTMPCLLPACLTAFIYFLLDKTKLTPTWIILIIFALSFVTYNLHILG